MTEIENLDGRSVTINKVRTNGINTSGKCGVIERYDTGAQKYLVIFDGNGQWYFTRHQFTVDDEEENEIENLDGKWVIITKVSDGGINTTGKLGMVNKFDTEAGKYNIEFENGWWGWYTRDEFVFDEDEEEIPPEEVKALILGQAKDLVSAFMYYDRKDDEDLCLYMIEQAVRDNVIVVGEIIKAFSTELRHKIQQAIKELE